MARSTSKAGSTLGLAGCGGGGSGGFTPTAASQTDRRELPQSFLTRAAINYSPYRTSRNVNELGGEVITPANVLEDLRLVQATGIGTIRLFSSRVHFEVTPNPVDFGWGLFQYSGTGTTANLSNFAGGQLKFQLRSDGHPGKIEVGISTDSEERDVQEAYLQIAPGQYGYCNSNSWCEVSIPISDFLAANPKLDLRYVNFRFIVADRYSFTGKPLNLTGLPAIRIDGLHWAR